MDRAVASTGTPTWPRQFVQAHARYLRDTHVPKRLRLGVRWIGGIVPMVLRRRVCRTCLQRWPCEVASWARQPERGGHG